jgi:ribosome-associated heat shock protein Hsp15
MAAKPPAAPAAGLRIDKLLWFLRLAATRDLAREWAIAGHIRLNGRRIERASSTIRAGDVLVLPLRGTVRVIEVLDIPSRRGPAPEAQACYRYVDSPPPGPHGHPDHDTGITGRA